MGGPNCLKLGHKNVPILALSEIETSRLRRSTPTVVQILDIYYIPSFIKTGSFLYPSKFVTITGQDLIYRLPSLFVEQVMA